jgi:predicted DNA-binding transcriptional regulator YafY
MTHRAFAATTRRTPRQYSTARSTVRRAIRVAWLVGNLTSRRPVRFVDYRTRFACSLRTFRRDLATVREAGMYLAYDDAGVYDLVCFRPEPDAA